MRFFFGGPTTSEQFWMRLSRFRGSAEVFPGSAESAGTMIPNERDTRFSTNIDQGVTFELVGRMRLSFLFNPCA